MADKPLSLQDQFLNNVRRSKSPVTVFLVKGVKLQGVITWFDAFSVLLRRDASSQLVYKHAISTIMPMRPPSDLSAKTPAAQSGKMSLQDRFLAAAGREQQSITLFLVYKHAISTLQPAEPLNLGGEEESAGGDEGA